MKRMNSKIFKVAADISFKYSTFYKAIKWVSNKLNEVVNERIKILQEAYII